MKTTILIFYLALSVATAHAQVDLNADGGKKVTVASEITRGYSAVIHIPMSGMFLRDSEQIFAVFERNKQAQTDSDGFMLGAKFAQWLLCDIAANRPVSSVNSAEVSELARKFESESFRDWRQRASSMGLSDQQLCEVVHAKYSVVSSRIEKASSYH